MAVWLTTIILLLGHYVRRQRDKYMVFRITSYLPGDEPNRDVSSLCLVN